MIIFSQFIWIIVTISAVQEKLTTRNNKREKGRETVKTDGMRGLHKWQHRLQTKLLKKDIIEAVWTKRSKYHLKKSKLVENRKTPSQWKHIQKGEKGKKCIIAISLYQHNHFISLYHYFTISIYTHRNICNIVLWSSILVFSFKYT